MGNRIRQLRAEMHISMREASKRLGLPYMTYVNYEKGARQPNSEMLIRLASFFGVTVDYLIGNNNDPSHRFDNEQRLSNPDFPRNIIPLPKLHPVPLVGTIACGSPILAEENLEGNVNAPADIHADFALRCQGDSMINARIFDGDLVYIRQQETVESGQIAAVLIDDEATLKRVRLYDDHIILEPENPQYKPLVYYGSEMESIRILGLAVAFVSEVR